MATGTERLGFVVSHTHWDRAWYLPFESFRGRLVGFLDGLLALLERNKGFRSFTLDGQSVLLEDYLALRPGNAGRIRALVRGGRLFIGPWYTLPDLFLSGGEAVVRNLQLGRAVCAPFGGAMPVGYVPDPFGHFGQMPQVLRGFGLSSYVFMRGLDAASVRRLGSVFDWRAPDGSAVTAVNLPLGYMPLSALGHPSEFGRFDGRRPTLSEALRRVRRAARALGRRQREPELLLLNGGDHMPVQPELPSLLQSLNRRLKGLRLVHASLPEYLRSLRSKDSGRPAFVGDLIGNADHPALLSVFSSRMYLKRLDHGARSALLRRAEPLCAALRAAGLADGSRPRLDHAWKALLKCHAHDDICGCSADPVHEEDEVRLRRVREEADTLVAEGLERMLLRGFRPSPRRGRGRPALIFAFNPHPFPRRSRVTAEVLFPDGDERAPASPPRLPVVTDERGREVPCAVLSSEGKVVRSAFLETTWGRRYRLLLDLDLPPMGYRVLEAREGPRPWRPTSARRGPLRLRSVPAELQVERGRLAYRDRDSGAELPDLLSFEYEMDGGDSYSHGPLPFGPWRAKLVRASPCPEDPGGLSLAYELRVPARLDRASMRPEGRALLRLDVAARLDGRTLALRVRYENTAQDGRLRAVFRTGLGKGRALVDAPFLLADRGIPEERLPLKSPYPGEKGYPTRHQGDFLVLEDADKRAFVANRGNPEYELLPRGAVAVTLHRAFGWLSVAGGGIRECQAGPSIPTPGGQCLRPLEHYLGFGFGDFSREEAAQEALSFSHPGWAREMPYLPHAPKRGPLPRTAALLGLREPGVLFSALRPAPAPARFSLRLYNPTGAPRSADLAVGLAASRWCPCGLDERWDEKAARPLRGGRLSLEFAPYQVRTVLFAGRRREEASTR